ncbi:hypothetical protein [Megamonas hypermegale]|nr:hypothetical protein [Megamonas hypermegale]MBM6833144.1 hypothetical protein [Megamonas hypermegale]
MMNDLTVGDILFWDEKLLNFIMKKCSSMCKHVLFSRRKKPPECIHQD